jgi:hypothetical protein
LRFHLNRPSRRARYGLPHAHTCCHDVRTHPADASTAWRSSARTALEPQPHPGALAGAAAGPARRALETPYAAAAALSNAPGIGAPGQGWDDVHGCEDAVHERPAFMSVPIAAGITPAWQGCSGRPRPTPRRMGLMQRGRRTAGKIWRTTPALANRYVCRTAPFQRANATPNSSRAH